MSSYTDSPPSCLHTAQNIVLSFHCDEPSSMLVELLQSFMIPQTELDQISNTFTQACTANNHHTSSSATHSSYTPTGQSATESAWLAGYSS